MRQRRLTWLMGWLLLAVALLMPNYGGAWAATSVTTSKPAQGDGSSSNPFQISNAQELAWFRDWVNGTYTPEDGESASIHEDACAKISDDVNEIDMSSVCGESIGSWEPICNSSSIYWNGYFDGNHKTIKNLYINSSNEYQGLFGRIYVLDAYYGACFIKDICFKDVNVTCTDWMNGILVGLAHKCIISGIKILSGTMKGPNDSGTIVGLSESSKISNCENSIDIITSGAYVGGLIGYANSSTIEKCINNGNIAPDTETTNTYTIGGISGGAKESTLSNCINLGNIKATISAGGIIGSTDSPNNILNNCFTYGNVETVYEKAGLLVGYAEYVQIQGNVIYNSDATITINNQIETARDFGVPPTDGSQATGLSLKSIKSGYAAYLLQQGAGEDGIWGQELGTDNYPMLGSTKTIYICKNISCKTGEIIDGYTNTPPSDSDKPITKHGSAIHHPAVTHTCLTDGNVAYYECSDCHKTFNDEPLTQPLTTISDPSHGHEYENDVCTLCHKQIPTLLAGTHDILIEKVIDSNNYPGSYNLFKYIAIGNGTLTSYTTGNEDTYGTLWNSELTEILASNDNAGDGNNFKLTYEVEMGKTYYIGVRQNNGNAIVDNYQITIEQGGNILVGTLGSENIFATKQGDIYLVENLNIEDGKQLAIQKDNVQLQSGSYSRSFAHDKWQALYVPFETEVTDELLNDFELAAPNNLHEYELADGSTKVVLEAKLMKSGYTIKALRPYLIRAKEAGEKTIQLADCPLKGAAEDSYVDCSSVLRHYKFIGTLKGKTSFDTTADLVLDGGIFLGAEPDAQLKPMRWYLNATDRDTDMGILPGGSTGGDSGSTQASRSIDITIVDGDATTGIDDLHVITEQASGFASTSRRGIYDLQGRKLSQEPLSGVYIKDGKKVVK